MTLSFGNRTVNVVIDAENARFSQGFGIYPLTLQLTITAYGFEASTLLEASAELEIHGNPPRWLASATHPIRVGIQTQTACQVSFPLTSTQILGIEEYRAGRRPGFTLRLHGYLPGDTSEGTHQESSDYFTIAASTWLDLIERVNASVAFTVPVPVATAEGAIAEGAALLKDARRLVNEGNIDAAIVTARKVLERAQAAAQWPDITRNEDLRERSQDQRWRAIWKAALDQAAGAAHEDEVTKDFSYRRREAEALIGIAASMLKAAPGPLD
jgi:hypothetical protein